MEKEKLLIWITESKESIDDYNAEVVRVMKLNNITNKTLQNNCKPLNIQYLLDAIEQCNFTEEQIKWINKILSIVNSGQYFEMLKELKPKAYEREVKERIKSFGNFRGLKF